MAFNRSNYLLYLSGAQLKKLIARILNVSEHSIVDLPTREKRIELFSRSNFFSEEGERLDISIPFRVGLINFALSFESFARLDYTLFLGLYSPFDDSIRYSPCLGFFNTEKLCFEAWEDGSLNRLYL